MKVNSSQNWKAKITAIYSQLSDKEKLIANFILNEPKKIIHSSISEIAETLGVADATVFRFCKRAGFKGFQAMKIALASESMPGSNDINRTIHEAISEDDDEATITRKVFESNIKTLNDTISLLNMDNLTKAVNTLVSARKIDFYGLGGSGAIAVDGHLKFLRSGFLTSCYTDSHLQVISASQLTEEDVVVCISHSGSTREIIEALEVAKSNGATTILITHYGHSILNHLADISLYTVSVETEFRSEALASRLAQLSIMDALYVNVSVKLNEQMKKSLQKMRKAISLKRLE